MRQSTVKKPSSLEVTSRGVDLSPSARLPVGAGGERHVLKAQRLKRRGRCSRPCNMEGAKGADRQTDFRRRGGWGVGKGVSFPSQHGKGSGRARKFLIF